MSASPESLILKSARETLSNAEKLVAYLEEQKVEEPNLTADSPPHPANNAYDALAIRVHESADELILLTRGPLAWLRNFICCQHDLGTWQTALRFNLFTIIPLDKPMAVGDIASAAKMDEDRLSRIIKSLTTQRCFDEVEENVFQHTCLSAFVARNDDIRNCLAFQADEMFEAASLMADSIQQAPYISDAAHSAFNLRFGQSPYSYYAEKRERGARFASAMAGYVQMNRDTTELRDRFPWGALGKARVVDVGGGSGHISMYLASQFPDLHFVVQDVNPVMLEQGPKRPDFHRVQDRVSFMQYSFYDPQPVHDAGLFLLRQVIHNYNDEVSVRIFKSFVPAMEKCGPSTGLLVNDMVLPPPNTKTKVEEHGLRQIDMAMLNGYAAKQRTLKEFADLLNAADPRFHIVKVHGEGIMGLVEVRLRQ